MDPFDMRAVASSNIEAIGYDSATQRLRVRFKGGRTYQFAGVPQERFDALASAESVGKCFAATIKLAHPGVPVEEPVEKPAPAAQVAP